MGFYFPRTKIYYPTRSVNTISLTVEIFHATDASTDFQQPSFIIRDRKFSYF